MNHYVDGAPGWYLFRNNTRLFQFPTATLHHHMVYSLELVFTSVCVNEQVSIIAFLVYNIICSGHNGESLIVGYESYRIILDWRNSTISAIFCLVL